MIIRKRKYTYLKNFFIKDESFEQLDYSDSNVERMNALRKILHAYEMADYENRQKEPIKTKRGRQCLWKICSWSLDNSKLKKKSN